MESNMHSIFCLIQKAVTILIVPIVLSGCMAVSGYDPANSGDYNHQSVTKKSTSSGDSYVFQDDVLFDFGKDKIKSELASLLDKVIEQIKMNDNHILIVGHTDDVGGFERNINLSEQRAKNVSQYIRKSGVEPARVSIVGLGMLFPVAKNDSDDGRQRNRRVVIHSIKQEAKANYLAKIEAQKNRLTKVIEERALSYEKAKENIGKKVNWLEKYRQYTSDCVELFMFKQCMWVTFPMQFLGTVKDFDPSRGEYIVSVAAGEIEHPKAVSARYYQYLHIAEQKVKEFVGKNRYVQFEAI